MRQSGVSMERIKAAANSRLMRLAQKMIVGGALLLDRVANSHLHRLWVIADSVMTPDMALFDPVVVVSDSMRAHYCV
jgi:hypothetical protein